MTAFWYTKPSGLAYLRLLIIWFYLQLSHIFLMARISSHFNSSAFFLIYLLIHFLSLKIKYCSFLSEREPEICWTSKELFSEVDTSNVIGNTKIHWICKKISGYNRVHSSEQYYDIFRFWKQSHIFGSKAKWLYMY